MANSSDWFDWAILSAVFAALTAAFVKIGLQGVDSDFDAARIAARWEHQKPPLAHVQQA